MERLNHVIVHKEEEEEEEEEENIHERAGNLMGGL